MKKDPNYIAAVEKEIAKKYGKKTVQDFRSFWDKNKEEDYLNQLKEVSGEKNQKRKNQLNIPRTCPVCKTYSFSRRDDLYMNRFKCCFECYVEFVEHREDRWHEGWRPDKEQIKNSLRRKK
jgi:predicted Zn-ribbon and HTH transcriptional regulator